MSDLQYSDRLKALGLPSLGLNRLREELIEVYKMTHENSFDWILQFSDSTDPVGSEKAMQKCL